jgi:phage shock protein C
MPTDTPHETSTDPRDPAPRPPGTGVPGGRLHRCRTDRMVAGVAGGLGEWFDVDPTLIRVAFAALTLLGGVAVPIYLAAWALIPEEGADVSVAEELLARERAR